MRSSFLWASHGLPKALVDASLDFVGYLQTTIALEILFGDKNLDGSLQVLLLCWGQPFVVRNIALEDLQP